MYKLAKIKINCSCCMLPYRVAISVYRYTAKHKMIPANAIYRLYTYTVLIAAGIDFYHR